MTLDHHGISHHPDCPAIYYPHDDADRCRCWFMALLDMDFGNDETGSA